MSLSVPDYRKIYLLQDKTLQLITPFLDKFYLTGGTALGRYYLNHRFSDDLDFFVNRNQDFNRQVSEIYSILKVNYKVDETVTLLTSDFVRIGIIGEVPLKLEFINDIAYRWGETIISNDNVPVDNVANILANKLTALISRDEPKDVFDIIAIADSYEFNWKDIYKQAFEKQIMNEADIAMRLSTFPVVWLEGKYWLMQSANTQNLKSKLKIIADDFLFANDNSLGIGKTPITEAKPIAKE